MAHVMATTAHDPSDTAQKVYLPPTTPPPLRAVTLSERISFPLQLSDQGWTHIDFRQDADVVDDLRDCLQQLLTASKAFFGQPQDEKRRYATSHGSEEGWSRVEGEKELITLRVLERTPEVLKTAADACWSVCGTLLNDILAHIAETLDLPPERLTAFSEPCLELNTTKTATMLRLFRYEGEAGEKVVAEPHNDLGLLSFVFGDVPGLEVWDRYTQSFFPLEKHFIEPAGSLLVGTQLARLTNQRYIPGGHRVCAYAPASRTERQPNYRYSVVFILRAHWPVPIDTNRLTTPLTGPFKSPMVGITAQELFMQISNAHFNINASNCKLDLVDYLFFAAFLAPIISFISRIVLDMYRPGVIIGRHNVRPLLEHAMQ